MIDNIKLMLGGAAANFSEEQISLYLKMAQEEVEDYCNRELDSVLENIAMKIAVYNLNRINTEGLTSESYSGYSQSFKDGYPAEIMKVLNKKRKIKVL